MRGPVQLRVHVLGITMMILPSLPNNALQQTVCQHTSQVSGCLGDAQQQCRHQDHQQRLQQPSAAGFLSTNFCGISFLQNIEPT